MFYSNSAPVFYNDDFTVDEAMPSVDRSRSSESSVVDVDDLLMGKNPISYLNEYCQKMGLVYRIEEEGVFGPSHQPSFQFVVFVGDEQFPAAQGLKKQAARTEAARLALETLITRASQVGIIDEQDDTIFAAGSNSFEDLMAASQNSQAESEDLLQVSEATQKLLEDTGKNPVSLLMEFTTKNRLPQPNFEDITDTTSVGFTIRLRLGDDIFTPSVGKNKKSAKTKAALIALDALVISGKFSLETSDLLPRRKIERPRFTDNANVYQRIGTCVNEMFYQASMKLGTEVADSGKVLAGVVMTEGDVGYYVVSLATGNRCIKGGQLSTDGLVLNDCHAEILARRGCVRFLYGQVADYISNTNNSIFEPSLNERNRLKLRDSISFHLYINTAPCGDGRVFCLSETAQSTALANSLPADEHRPVMTDRKKHGLLRTKIESGEGTIPTVDYCEVQTLDGITGGERLRTMSCSDKILKWNALGIQGSLLSQFMEPIYLKSIVIGTLFHHGHLSRAVCCRASLVPNLTPGYNVNHPVLARAGLQSNVSRDTSKSGSISTTWNYKDQQFEILDGTLGTVNRSKRPSRLCKKNFYENFKELCEKTNTKEQFMGSYYRLSKSKASSYLEAKNALFRMCRDHGYGMWLGKPREEKLFE